MPGEHAWLGWCLTVGPQALRRQYTTRPQASYDSEEEAEAAAAARQGGGGDPYGYEEDEMDEMEEDEEGGPRGGPEFFGGENPAVIA